MRERTAIWGLAGVALALGLSLGLACSSDDTQSSENPEPPPTTAVDAGTVEAGDQTGCPSGPPRIGETCRRSPDVTDQTCRYDMGGCTVNGVSYDNIDEYRCYEGTWHLWNGDDNKCRTP